MDCANREIDSKRFWVDISYIICLDIKNTTDSTKYSSYLDLLLSIDANKHLHTKLYDKRDDFDVHMVNYPFLDSNIPLSPAYGVYIAQLIRYFSITDSGAEFHEKGRVESSCLSAIMVPM